MFAALYFMVLLIDLFKTYSPNAERDDPEDK